jgi:hypothetical protein
MYLEKYNNIILKMSEISEDTIEITDKVRSKMLDLIDVYNECQSKLEKVNALKKELASQLSSVSSDLTTLMKFYSLNELIKDNKKFVLDIKQRKKQVNKKQFREIISNVISDSSKVGEIYDQVDHASEMVVVEKLKCLKN